MFSSRFRVITVVANLKQKRMAHSLAVWLNILVLFWQVDLWLVLLLIERRR